MRWLPSTVHPLSRIGLRLLAFNLLVMFVPVFGVLYLDIYEARLRQAQEAGLVQQARVLAAALGDRPALDDEAIAGMFARLERRSDARFRVYDTRGVLIADSARQAAGTAVDEKARYPASDEGRVRSRMLYRAGAWLAYIRERGAALLRTSSERAADGAAPARRGDVPTEVRAALAGRYGAATRITAGQRSLTMFSAVPVRHERGVTGVVVSSQSTLRILQTLYAVRLRIFQIVVTSLVAAAILTALAAGTIVRPLTRLRRRASALAERRGPLPAVFPGADRKDEIGSLARALGELSRRTNDHIDLLQSFSADVSHELKNPLASIRTAAEMMAVAESESERRRFLGLMTKDVSRLERLVSGLRDVARVEREIEQDASGPVDLVNLLREVIDGVETTSGPQLCLAVDPIGARPVVHASRDRLAQVFENLIANAMSFAPHGTPVDVRVTAARGSASVTVEDHGPGIPEAHLDRVFRRFFTYRPTEGRGDHVGLGLAIARQIVESYNGEISAANRSGGGARLEVRLPAS